MSLLLLILPAPLIDSAGRFLHDTFTETGGVLLSAHDAEIGSPWAQHSASGTTLVATGGSGRMRAGAAELEAVYWAAGTPDTGEYDVAADVHLLTIGGGGYAGVLARARSTATTWYEATVDASGVVRLRKRTAGRIRNLGRATVPVDAGLTMRVRLRCWDAYKVVDVDGRELIAHRDNMLVDQGAAGVVLNAGSVGDVTTAGVQLAGVEAVDLSRAVPRAGSGSTRIASALPSWWGRSPYFAALYAVQGAQLDTLAAEYVTMRQQAFVSRATWALADWERQVGITVDTTKTVADRRAAIRARMLATDAVASGDALRNAVALRLSATAVPTTFVAAGLWSVQKLADEGWPGDELFALAEHDLRRKGPAHLAHGIAAWDTVNGLTAGQIDQMIAAAVDILTVAEIDGAA